MQNTSLSKTPPTLPENCTKINNFHSQADFISLLRSSSLNLFNMIENEIGRKLQSKGQELHADRSDFFWPGWDWF